MTEQTISDQERRAAEKITQYQDELMRHYKSMVGLAEAFLRKEIIVGGYTFWAEVAAERILQDYPLAVEAAKFRISLAEAKPQMPSDNEIRYRHDELRRLAGGSLQRAAELLLLGRISSNPTEESFAAMLHEHPEVLEIAKFRVLNGMCKEQQKAA